MAPNQIKNAALKPLRSFFEVYGSMLNTFLIICSVLFMGWMNQTYVRQDEIAAYALKGDMASLVTSLDKMRDDMQRQRMHDIDMVERQLREVTKAVQARQTEHSELHRLVIRLETIVERQERLLEGSPIYHTPRRPNE